MTDFKFKIQESYDELFITGTRIRFNGTSTTDSIYLKKYSIGWIIATLRSMSIKEYSSLDKPKMQKFPDYDLFIRLHIHDGDYSWITISPLWESDKKYRAPIEIPYLAYNDNLLMGEFIEPFLSELEKYVPQEERETLPKPWKENMSRLEWEEYRKRKPKGEVKLKFVEEIDPKEYFG